MIYTIQIVVWFRVVPTEAFASSVRPFNYKQLKVELTLKKIHFLKFARFCRFFFFPFRLFLLSFFLCIRFCFKSETNSHFMRIFHHQTNLYLHEIIRKTSSRYFCCFARAWFCSRLFHTIMKGSTSPGWDANWREINCLSPTKSETVRSRTIFHQIDSSALKKLFFPFHHLGRGSTLFELELLSDQMGCLIFRHQYTDLGVKRPWMKLSMHPRSLAFDSN